MAAPTLATYAKTLFDTTTSKSVTVAVNAGDLLVVQGSSENELYTIATPTATGVTFTLRQSIVVTDYATAYVWTAPIVSSASLTISTSRSVTNGSWGFGVYVFSGHGGVGASSKANVASGAPSLALTTTASNSAILVLNADWNAVNGSGRVWRTGAGTFTEENYFLGAGLFTVYAGYHPDAGVAGLKTVGLSAPTGQKYSIIALEVLPPASTPTNFSGSGNYSATGVLSGSGSPAFSSSHAFSASGSLTSVGQAHTNGAGSFSAAGSLAGSGTPHASGTGSLSATGSLTGSGTAHLSGSGGFSADGVLVGNGSTAIAGSGNFSSSGVLSGTGSAIIPGVSHYTGSGNFTSSGTITGSGTAALFGSGSLTSSGQLTGQGMVALSGAGAFSATGTLSGHEASSMRNVTVHAHLGANRWVAMLPPRRIKAALTTQRWKGTLT